MEKRCQHVLLPVSGAIPGVTGYECIFCSKLFPSYEDAVLSAPVTSSGSELAL